MIKSFLGGVIVSAVIIFKPDAAPIIDRTDFQCPAQATIESHQPDAAFRICPKNSSKSTAFLV